MLIDKDTFYNTLKETVAEHHSVFARLDWMVDCSAEELLGSVEAHLLVSNTLRKFNIYKPQDEPHISQMILMLPGIIKETSK